MVVENDHSTLLNAHSKHSFSRLLFESKLSNGFGHYDRSITFRFFQLVVLIIRLVTPFSYVYLLALYSFNLGPKDLKVNSPTYYTFLLWMIAEALFFPYYYYLFTKMNILNDELDHYASDKESRFQLVKNCFEAMYSSALDSDIEPELYLRKVFHFFLNTNILFI
jgi:hypothetical protein